MTKRKYDFRDRNTLKKPKNEYIEREYISGSRCPGADQYDRNFDGLSLSIKSSKQDKYEEDSECEETDQEETQDTTEEEFETDGEDLEDEEDLESNFDSEEEEEEEGEEEK